MLSVIRNAITSPLASSSRHAIFLPTPVTTSTSIIPSQSQIRWKSTLAPRRTKHRKSMKGLPISLPVGGSIKGTTLCRGTFGLRALSSIRLTADQLSACMVAIKRKIRQVRGSQCYMRVFPDQPVCVKGNETRMGKGKGKFEYWAVRVSMGKVLFEVGGGGIQASIAKAALKLAQDRLPIRTEFIDSTAGPRLGHMSSTQLHHAVQGQVVNVDKATPGEITGTNGIPLQLASEVAVPVAQVAT